MKVKSPYNSKLFGILLLTFGVFGMLIIAHRLSYYVYEFDPQYSPVDYGKYNILSYFTVQSNFFGYVYLIASALAVFGSKKAAKFAFSPFVGALATTYIFIAGLVYCCGIPMGFTPPSKWDTAAHAFSSFIQIFYHMIMPPFMIILWFFPSTGRRITMKKAWLAGIYPFAYSIFSIIRGVCFPMHCYAYPFYDPQFVWETVFPGKEINYFGAFAIISGMLALGIMFFVGICAAVIAIHNKRTAANAD